MPTWQHAVIVGASSGIGAAIARELALQGTAVALVARRTDELAELNATITAQGGHAAVFPHDVHDRETVPLLLQQIARDLGGLDLLVYAAGIMPAGKGFDTARDVDVMTVNLLGAIAWCNAAAERFVQLSTGTIIGISSVAGDRGRRVGAAYGASKAGLTTYLEALRNRVAVKGVTVVTMKPGYVATPMLAGASIPRIFPVLSADAAARLTLRAARHRRPERYIPRFWVPVMWLVRAIPSRIFRRLNI